FLRSPLSPPPFFPFFSFLVRHSQSFAGVSLQGCPGRTGDAVSTQLRQQKKALLVAVSASVDKIVAHFSAARNLVQKAQLGDSQLTPNVGDLILNTLCPALHALVGDGLKPFQKDVITGHRPSSPWSVIEASARPGRWGMGGLSEWGGRRGGSGKRSEKEAILWGLWCVCVCVCDTKREREGEGGCSFDVDR
uniref:RUN domain-containing protein n=1 Tax=Pseudonaja textilis TaxID=8673 RepID=A0A670YX84_PSETE